MAPETSKADETRVTGEGASCPSEDRVQSLVAKRHHRALSVPKVLTPWAVDETRILLLESINPIAVKLFQQQGYIVDQLKHALDEDQLIQHLQSNHYSGLGIRSKTRVTERVIKEAGSKLLVIGCFCIGTNQVDLDAAAAAGICVFNSPFSNSRSVAELVIGELIALARQLTDRSSEIHKGVWNKVSKGCWEVRGKTLGIVGYGHIGSQLSVLAEAMGMNVIYYDVLPIMPLGSATQIDSLEAMLSQADFVTLHVPELPETINLMSAKEIAHMKPGSYLINNSRGRVVDIPALVEAMEAGRVAGAALDVFPNEPGSNAERFDDQLNPWTSRLLSLPNLILTPHIGGSTEEAQKAIGNEVSTSMIKYLNLGSTVTSVNFPEVSLRPILESGLVRVCHVHHNQPGVLKIINSILAEYNVEKQYSDSTANIAYLMADIQLTDNDNRSKSHIEISELFSGISNTMSNIKTRILY